MRSSTAGLCRSATSPPEVLALAAREGDPDALAELYRRVWPVALATVRAACGWDESEDAVAEGFARALDRLDQLRDPAAIEAWLTRSAVRAATDLARKRRRAEPGGTAADLPRPRDPHIESAAEGAFARSDRAAIAASVEALPDDLRRLARLRFDAGLSVREVADLLSLPEGTIRRRCFDAYRLIRQRFLRQHLRPAAGECAVVTDQLCRAACRRLSSLAERRVEQHLRRCAGCQHRQRELTAFGQPVGRRPAGP